MFVVLAGSSGAATAEEGRFTVVDCFSGAIDLITQSEETLWLSWTQTGTRRSVPAGGPFDRMSGRCVGFLWRNDGHFQGRSACEYIDAEQHKVFLQAQRDGDGAVWEFTGGTGKYEGITGSGVYTDFGYFPRMSPTTYQFCPESNGSYAIPERGED